MKHSNKRFFFFSINTALHIVEGSGAPLAWLAAGAVYKALFGESGGKRRRRRRGDEGGVNQIIIAGEIEFGQLIKYFTGNRRRSVGGDIFRGL